MKYCIIFVMLALGIGTSGFAQNENFTEPEPVKTLHEAVFIGNINGLGLGLNYSPAAWIGFDGLLGVGLPYMAFLPAPYKGQQYSATLRLRLTHPFGFYAVAGWFGGSYNIKQNTGNLSVEEEFLIQAPIAAIGFSWPKQPTEVQLLLEVGGGFGLPQELAATKNDLLDIYELKTRRSSSSTKNFSPFFTILFQL